ncbi:hypothetical protein TNIN_322671 [Trichonephila inaurata madagascariensis]|uniref:Uncharacterized protein n=1 Tax=Trichonephila inaurata madagascariensis TaxID=2747483 RepID=A0A8X6Y5I0_9ARAC|nr:hypothetical protein TNIN_322671 [Trichonephila inaurata madagascariensis]
MLEINGNKWRPTSTDFLQGTSVDRYYVLITEVLITEVSILTPGTTVSGPRSGTALSSVIMRPLNNLLLRTVTYPRLGGLTWIDDAEVGFARLLTNCKAGRKRLPFNWCRMLT